MPRRLLLAAEIVSDVAGSSDDPEFRRLLTVADDLRESARELGDRAGIDRLASTAASNSWFLKGFRNVRSAPSDSAISG